MSDQYLKQIRELYGDELYLEFDLNMNDNSTISHSKINYESDLDAFNNQINACQKCSIGSTRKKFVFGTGDPNASLFLIGEAPDEQEDLKGKPFVGSAGILLDKILLAINRSREKDVYISNLIKCRPPKNREPLPIEVKECEPYLLHQINLIKPKLIVALGRVAGMTLLNVDNSLKSMRGKIHNYNGTQLIVTYHPATLLKNSNSKPEAWKDFKWIRSIID